MYYILRSLPAGLFRPDRPEPFRQGLPTWRKLGLSAIVERVGSNGTLIDYAGGRHLLAVWPEGREYTPPLNLTEVVIDEELTIAWNGDTPPGPDDLDNDNPLRLSCVPVVLADGAVWQVPEIREPGGTLLPCDLVRDRRTGQLKNPLKREYEALWAETEYWFDLFWKRIEGTAKTFELERGVAFATQVLGLRYRFCDATQSALRIIDSTNLQTVIQTAIGWDAVIQRIREIQSDDVSELHDSDQKKTLDQSSGSLSANSGLEASGLTTAQPAASNGSPHTTPAQPPP